MKSKRPWGWTVFLGFDFLALVVWPIVLFLLKLAGIDLGAVSWAALVLGGVAFLALMALIFRRAWGRWLLLVTATLRYGLELGLAGMMVGRGFPNGLEGSYLVIRPLVLLGVHWVYLTHREVRRYLL